MVDAKRELTDPLGTRMKTRRTPSRIKDKGDDGDHFLDGRSGGNAAQKMHWIAVGYRP